MRFLHSPPCNEVTVPRARLGLRHLSQSHGRGFEAVSFSVDIIVAWQGMVFCLLLQRQRPPYRREALSENHSLRMIDPHYGDNTQLRETQSLSTFKLQCLSTICINCNAIWEDYRAIFRPMYNSPIPIGSHTTTA